MEQTKLCMGCMEYYDASLDVCPCCGYVDGTESSHVLHMRPGTILKRRFVVGKALGYGSFGVTYIGWDKLMKRKVAIKEYLPSEYATRTMKDPDLIIPNIESTKEKYEKGLSKFGREAEKLAAVGQTDGVVYIYDTFEENNTAYIVMEYLEGETLAAYLAEKGKLSEDETLDLMLPVLQALEEVYQKGIIHRDISPDNLFVSIDSAGNKKVKLIDFGAARFASSSHSKSLTVLLRPGYSPEEQYRSSGEQGPHTDVYAIAAVMYQMVTGVRPPDALERRTAIERKKKDIMKDPSVYNPDLSENFENALLNALNVRIEDRTETADDFLKEAISFEKVKRRGSNIKKIDFFRWPLWAKIGVPAAGIAALALVIGVAIWLSGLSSGDEVFTMPENCTRVVNFTGATLLEAQQMGEEYQLNPVQADSEYSATMTQNRVLKQDQVAGAIVPVNTTVNLVISTAIETYSIPDVTGMTLSDAQYALECMGMEVLTEEGTQEGLAANCVIAQSIEPYSMVNYGETVVLTVTPDGSNSAGIAPDLVGKSYADALLLAYENGVQLSVSDKVFTDDYENTQVLTQDIPAGETVNADDSIQVTIAISCREFSMPSLMYKDKDTALQLLKNIGLTGEIEEKSSEIVTKGLVYEQSIDKDATITPGQSVTLTVSSGSTPFEMPDVVGLPESEASEQLETAKLAVKIERGYSDTVPEGSVISQSIAGGDNVTRGTEVTLVICSYEGLVTVENAVGMTYEVATDLLSGAGFQVQKNEIYSETVESGVVIEQLPAAGTVQNEGTVITLTVSKGVDPETIVESESPEVEESAAETNSTSKETTTGKKTSWKWSDWSTTVPSSSSEYETKDQYRYRTRETTAYSGSSLDGWTWYDTVATWSDYGAWSDWSTSEYYNDDSTKVETKTQYRYRDESTSTSTSYGDWSSWQDGAISSSSTLEVETRQVQASAEKTTYTYGAYFSNNSSKPYNWTHFCPTCGNTLYGGTWTYKEYTQSTRATVISFSDACGHKGNFSTEYRAADGYLYYYEKKNTTPATYKTQYRSRKIITTQNSSWGDWSGWSDTAYSASDTRQVDQRTLYRYCTRTLNYTYYFERWGDWSSYSDTAVSATSDREVQTRTLYRYKIYY